MRFYKNVYKKKNQVLLCGLDIFMKKQSKTTL
jgi:hypothetical protein